jgi:tripartite-type tricarboxylate transporter receptor subunit TctC
MRAILRLVVCAIVPVWAIALGFATPARAQTQLLIPWPPGGGTDIIGRLIQPAFSEMLGGQIVIRNVGGATGTIGTAEVVRAKPDGTTLLLTSMSAVVIQPSFLTKPPYQANQLATVCLVAEAPATLMTQKDSGFTSVIDIVAEAESAPGQLPYATGGVGGLGHLAMVGLARAYGITLNHIPFRGSGDAVLALQQGTVRMLTAEANLVAQYGFRALAVFAEKRSPDTPDAPTLRELGHDLVFPLWTGIFAPADTPEPVLARLDAACAKTLRTPSVMEGMARASHPIRYLDHAAFGHYVRAEAVKYAQVIREAGLRQAD